MNSGGMSAGLVVPLDLCEGGCLAIEWALVVALSE